MLSAEEFSLDLFTDENQVLILYYLFLYFRNRGCPRKFYIFRIISVLPTGNAHKYSMQLFFFNAAMLTLKHFLLYSKYFFLPCKLSVGGMAIENVVFCLPLVAFVSALNLMHKCSILWKLNA